MLKPAPHPLRGAAHATVGDLTSLDAATGWLDTAPITSAGLLGRVVLVSFWTYSCINWRRTLPHLRAWEARYRADGLTIIGVHTPEFAFENDVLNVRRAAADAGITYPIVRDDDYAIWRDLENQYWPALYFVDVQGRARYRSFGEENYDQAEGLIQQLLDEAGAPGERRGAVEVEGTGVEAAADWADLRTPETYLGHDRADRFASPGGAVHDHRHAYEAPTRVRLNRWALAGDWTVGHQAVTSHDAGGRIVLRFSSRDVHLVMGAAERGGSSRFRVLLDGRPPGSAHGLDVDAEGFGTVAEPRLYQLIRQARPIRESTFEVTFLEAGVDAYVFTFG